MQRSVAEWLARCGCAGDVTAIATLAAYDQPHPVRVLRLTTTQGCFVAKMLAEAAVSREEEEQQAAFSEFLRAQGLPVPQKFRCDGYFVSLIDVGGARYLATLEEDFGADLCRPTVETAYALGRFLGRMHRCSLASGFQLPAGHTWRALLEGRTNACDIWQGKPSDHPTIRALCCRHDAVSAALRRLWPQLPRAAVHGDLSLTSNLVQRGRTLCTPFEGNGIGVIDFNLAGEEVLVGDFLITWYSARWQPDLCARVAPRQWAAMAQAYRTGYQRERCFTVQEKRVLPQLARSMNGTYCHRLLATLWQTGRHAAAQTLLSHALHAYELFAPNVDLAEVLHHGSITSTDA